MAKLPTCWRKEGALGNRPPPSPGLPGKMPGTEEAPRGVGIILCCLGALGWWGGRAALLPAAPATASPPTLLASSSPQWDEEKRRGPGRMGCPAGGARGGVPAPGLSPVWSGEGWVWLNPAA